MVRLVRVFHLLVYDTRELVEDSTCVKIAQVQQEGSRFAKCGGKIEPKQECVNTTFLMAHNVQILLMVGISRHYCSTTAQKFNSSTNAQLWHVCSTIGNILLAAVNF